MSSAEIYAVDAQGETPQGHAENHDRDPQLAQGQDTPEF